MSLVQIRKKLLNVESIYHEGGPARTDPIKMGSIAVVLKNPYAGRYVEDLEPFVKDATEMANALVPELIAALGGADKIEAYGKGAIVGINGELEHAALWHQPSGFGIRHAMGGAKSIVPSTVKVASAGARIDIPLHHVTAAYVRSHFDAIEFCVPDGPKPDEIVFIVAAAIGGRPHARVGGLTPDGIKVGDGQR